MLSLAIFGFEQKVLPDTMDGFAFNVSLLPVHKSSNALKERLSCLRLALSHLSIRRRCFWISLFVLMSLTITALLACGFLQWRSAVPVDVLPLDSASSRLPKHLIPENYFTAPPTVYFRDSLHNDTRYITSFLSAGFTNDVMTLGNLIYLALITSRVAILPPFTSHIRSIAAPLPFSEIFDVPRLITALNAPVLEWSQVKDLEAAARQDVQDIIGCWNVWEVDNVGADGPRGSFTPHLLNLHISYTRAPPDIKLMAGYEHDSHSTFWSLARLAFPEARAEVLARPDLNPSVLLSVRRDQTPG
ncbi:hypothetical protein A0H81_00085 [Grifola frondosa]|uniref:Uncharacterized protein n=1 Tax=Grifola frondosa TaxID=5627 RepID=A0A1C7MRJ5_GRIFR|nr:hypothetical protein A0H81_00085 [Grifola frondosa]